MRQISTLIYIHYFYSFFIIRRNLEHQKLYLMRSDHIPTFYWYKSGRLCHYFSQPFCLFFFGIIFKMWNMSVLLGSVGGESGRALAERERDRERERVASLPSPPPMAISLITVPCSAVWSCGHRPAYNTECPGQFTKYLSYLYVPHACFVSVYPERRHFVFILLKNVTQYKTSPRDSTGGWN